ncbi:uncharacterized protein PG998_013679 [Apiospora kogelbergensis]|uniref:uncharacterized protein n=1 Tax=Apiospora kogelbergensis TaxID=1337665 RepID=UPI00312FC136
MVSNTEGTAITTIVAAVAESTNTRAVRAEGTAATKPILRPRLATLTKARVVPTMNVAKAAAAEGEARPRGRDSIHPSSYDSSSVPPPKYKHGSDVPWEDSVYHTGNGTKASSSYKPSSSKSRQSRPTYTSHDYVYGQQHDPVAACAGDVMKPTYTMNNAYATMPGHGNDSGYVNNSYSYDDGGGDVVGQRDNATYECEEEGERRRVRSTHERKVKRASKSAD